MSDIALASNIRERKVKPMDQSLPEGWSVHPLRDLTERAEDAAPTRQPNDLFRYIDVSSVSNKSLRVESTSTLFGRDAPSRARKRVRVGDTLYATVRPSLRRVAYVGEAFDGCICSTGFCVLRPRQGQIGPRFLYYCLLSESVHRSISALERGSSYPAVSDRDVLDAMAVVPPLAEQDSIAVVLGKLQAAAAAQQTIIDRTAELKAALMAKLFTEGTRGEPARWNVKRLGDVARIGNGSTPKRDREEYWSGGTIPWLTSGKIHETIIDEADEFVTEVAKRECHLPLVKNGSVVVAITGQGKTLGNAAMVRLDTCISQHLAYIQFNQPGEISSEYVLFYLQSQYARFRQVSQAGGTTKGALTCAFLRNYPLPLPPGIEQREIADVFSTVESVLRAARMRKAVYEELFSATLDELLTGRIRVNDLDLAELGVSADA
jgi:type I restriction enzyme S subunit